VSISNFDKDFGIDGTFRQITAIGNRRFTSGYALDFQLKSSINYAVESEYIVYDLEVKTYNDLVYRRLSTDATPCILILKVLSFRVRAMVNYYRIRFISWGCLLLGVSTRQTHPK
jgi:hypothetical protein